MPLAALGLILLAAIACGSAGDLASPSPTTVPADPSVSREPVDESALQPAPLVRAVDPEGDGRFRPGVGLPVDAINPVYEPEFVSADEVDLLPDELVMGLEIDGDARAYPVGLLRFREIVNDVVGGTPVLITW